MNLPETIIASACVALPISFITAYMSRINERARSRRDKLTDYYSETLNVMDDHTKTLFNIIKDPEIYGKHLSSKDIQEIVKLSPKVLEIINKINLLEGSTCYYNLSLNFVSECNKLEFDVITSYYTYEDLCSNILNKLGSLYGIMYNLRVSFRHHHYPPPHPAYRLLMKILRKVDEPIRKMFEQLEKAFDETTDSDVEN